MKNTILNKNVIKNLKKVFITTLIIALVVVIGFNGKLLSESLFDDNIYTSANAAGHYFEMFGSVKESKNWESYPLKNIENAEITILNKEYRVIGVAHSNKIGMCILKLPLDKQFTIKVSKKGWVTKIIHVDTRLRFKKFKRYYMNYEIEMFEDISGVDASILRRPIAMIKYNNSLKCFDYNYDYTDDINERLRKRYANHYKLHPENKIARKSKQEKKLADTKRVKYIPNNLDKINTNLSEKNNYNEKNRSDFVESEEATNIYKTIIDSFYYSKNNNNIDNGNTRITDSTFNNSEIVFKIQVLVLDDYLSPDAEFFKNCGKVDVYIHNGKHKYTVGEFKTFEEASKLLYLINNKGYNDAFLVSFKKGKRINVNKALSIQNDSKK